MHQQRWPAPRSTLRPTSRPGLNHLSQVGIVVGSQVVAGDGVDLDPSGLARSGSSGNGVEGCPVLGNGVRPGAGAMAVGACEDRGLDHSLAPMPGLWRTYRHGQRGSAFRYVPTGTGRRPASEHPESQVTVFVPLTHGLLEQGCSLSPPGQAPRWLAHRASAATATSPSSRPDARAPSA